ncbi:glycosyl hydrolase family 18 protein [Desulfolucanica intricata]|uniref:glycosyl hydrolase family 18 protein n=1 Tax=Desulfolucanica intricata TaxID=1285191 RepID=UPI000836B1A2|nr:glycosyl hydrolase family 18 protein [Desulfolucanica intricata]
MFIKNQNGAIKGLLIFLIIILLLSLASIELKKDRYSPGQRENLLLMAYYDQGWNKETLGLPSLRAHNESLDILSPNWYSVNSVGSIVLSRGSIESEVGQILHGQDIKLLPLLTNHKGNYEVLADEKILNLAAKNIVNLVIANDYDGINIDFELIPPQLSNEFATFIKLIKSELQNKLVMVSVFPKVDFPEQYHGAHDYQKLEPFADYICLMAYDKSSPKTGPGPIAPIRWVEDNINNALKTIPPHKLILAVNAYGYDWSLQSGTVEAVGISQAEKKAAVNQTKLLWDRPSQTPYFNYQENNNKHTVWYENNQSVALKVNLAQKYNLAGIAFWRLGYENKAFINELSRH